MPPVPAASIQLPERYRVLRHVANGGMASVWEAHDELLGRDVAVKVLAAHLTQDDTARVRFQREARAAAGLSGHPHIVTIYDIGEHAGRSFIVMEMMRRPVADLLAGEAPIPTDQALRWLREAASGLDAAHEARIVHRDVKPANMLLDSRDRLALGDFGIARLAYETQVTATGTLLGTSSYISPEQALGEPATAASDRYALAVVAFQMLTGGKPFQAEHFAAQARAHIEDPPPRASERRPELGTGADAVLERGMAKDPAARWATAREFVDELQRGIGASVPAAATTVIAAPETTRLVTGEPVGAAPATPGERPVPPDASPVAGDRPGPHRHVPAPAKRPQRRWGVVALVSGLLLLAGIATALALTAGGGDAPSPRVERPEPTPTAAETEEPTPDPTPERTPEATPEPPEATPETTPAPTAAPDADGDPDPAAAAPLNDQGFTLNRAGRYQEALQPLSQAYALCQGSDELDPCGYTAYNYAVALNRSGDPGAAIPILEERLARFGDNSDGDVAQELADARREARGNGRGRGNGNGNGNGNG